MKKNILIFVFLFSFFSGLSLFAQNVPECNGNISYQGYDYSVKRYDCNCWMTENLRSTHYADETEIPFANYYQNKEANLIEYGRLYDYFSATKTSSSSFSLPLQGVCPDGWYLPTYEDFQALANLEGGASHLLSSSSVYWLGTLIGQSPADGFNVLPGGWYNVTTGRYENMLGNAAFWTSSVVDGQPRVVSFQYACPDLMMNTAETSMAFSVRCIKYNVCTAPQLGKINVDTLTGHTMHLTCPILFDGGKPVTETQFCYTTNPDGVTDLICVPAVLDTFNSFSVMFTDLSPNIPVYVSAIASNSVGSTTEHDTITTLLVAPTLGEISFSRVSKDTLTLRVPITYTGGEIPTTATICAYTDSAMTAGEICADTVMVNSSLLLVTGTLGNLTPDIHYYIKVTASNSANTAITIADTVTHSFCPGLPTVSDHQGHVYNTVQIGSQCWTKENMRCTTSPTGKNWIQLNGGQSSTFAPYYAILTDTVMGCLYNWHAAIDTNLTTAVDCILTGFYRGICPDGWHIPSNIEWTQLTDYLGGEAVAGGKMKSTSSLWNSPNTDATNSSLFSALPAGTYDDTNINNSGINTIFWSSTQKQNNAAWNRYLYHNYGGCNSGYGKYYGFSVRCLKN
ncbi:MAG: fibrobacter succinogenes major paralogous domain-containing protein [Bacteroidales bacterium]